MYNIMTCQGSDWTTSIFGGCSQAWFVLAILFFIVLILRRQCQDGVFSGVGFSFIGALVIGLGVSVVLTSITGEARWSFLGGLIGLAAGGFGLGLITDSGGSYE